ncbi:MAG: hypothetical protein M0T83_06565, partial [Nitrospiraceae bacterium]|nr:hypothetical protein [Nitrospiraceae bacterium]
SDLLAAYMDTTSEGLSPTYTVPKTRDEKIVCDFCEGEVPIVIGLGTLWLCERCFDDAREQWMGGKNR